MARNQQPSLVFVGKTGAYLSRVFCSFSLMADSWQTITTPKTAAKTTSETVTPLTVSTAVTPLTAATATPAVAAVTAEGAATITANFP